MESNIFEVSRNEYKGFVEEIKPECRRVEVVQISNNHMAAKIYSKKTGKCLCSRVAYCGKSDEPEPEKYYIFEMPDDDESQASIPVRQLVLSSKEEVQAFFDALSKLNKEKQND